MNRRGSALRQNTRLPALIQSTLNRAVAGATGLSGPQIVAVCAEFSLAIKPYKYLTSAPKRAAILEDCLARLSLRQQKAAIRALLEFNGAAYGPAPAEDIERIHQWLGNRTLPLARNATDLGWSKIDAQRKELLERLSDSPRTAITLARSLVETTCFHLLAAAGRPVPRDGRLQRLYRAAAELVGLMPEQNSDPIAATLRGSLEVLNGLGEMRNKMGSAHGTGLHDPVTETKHARLAAYSALALSDFLIDSYRTSSLRRTEVPALPELGHLARTPDSSQLH